MDAADELLSLLDELETTEPPSPDAAPSLPPASAAAVPLTLQQPSRSAEPPLPTWRTLQMQTALRPAETAPLSPHVAPSPVNSNPISAAPHLPPTRNTVVTAARQAEWVTNGGGDIEPYLSSGAFALIDAEFILSLHERGGRFVRRQDLPPDAFITTDELKAAGCPKMGGAGMVNTGLPIICLSYPWLQVSCARSSPRLRAPSS